MCIRDSLYIVTIITVIANINSMNERTQLLYDEPFANVESSLWMIANLQSVGKNVTLLISTEDVVDEEEYLEKMCIRDSSRKGLQLFLQYQTGN